MVLNRILKIGGSTLDQSVVNHIRYTNDFLIGKMTGETLRKGFGLSNEKAPEYITVSGRDLVSGVPEQIDISADMVRTSIKEHVQTCAKEIKTLLERTPPEVLRSIQKDGIYLTGGLANLAGLDSYIESFIGLKVNTVSEPETCTVKGLKQIIQSKELRKLTYSMLNDNYRWMK